jgi:hypothetical protein
VLKGCLGVFQMGGVFSIPVNLSDWESLKKEANTLYKTILHLSISSDYKKYIVLKNRWDYIIQCMIIIAQKDYEKTSGRMAWIEEIQIIMRSLVRKYNVLHKTEIDSKEEPLISQESAQLI